MKTVHIFIFCYFIFLNISLSKELKSSDLDAPYYNVHYFSTPNEKIVSKIKDPSDNLFIFCYEGENKNWLNLWKTVGVKLSLQNENFEIFQGINETAVDNAYRQSYSVFHFMPWKTKVVEFDIFKKSCIGVYSELEFSVTFEVIYINFWKFFRLLCGLTLYLFAPNLSSNLIFYYSFGIILGITASLLIFVYLLSRLIPKKIGAASVLFGGSAMVLYVLQLVYSNLKVIVFEHQSFVITYLVVAGFVSFAVCYRYGTVDEKTQNLIKWLLQGIGLLLIFFSTEWKEVATSIILVVLTLNNFPAKWKTKLQILWRRRFPAKVKVLTEEEYHMQSAEETKKALESLREFCNSPKCKSWELMRKLNSPLRFAEFVEGKSHLSDEEMLNYELDNSFNDLDDDFDEDISSFETVI